MPRYHTRPFDDDMFKSLILSSINHPFHMDTGHIDKMGGFSIDYQTYYVVMELLGLTKPRKVLELGYGYSTILLQ